MVLLNNFYEMPIPFRTIVGSGFIFPVLMFVTFLRKDALGDFVGLSLFISISALVLISCLLTLQKRVISRALLLISWLFASISPLYFDIPQSLGDVIHNQILFNMILGAGMGFYLFRAKSVSMYFRGEKTEGSDN